MCVYRCVYIHTHTHIYMQYTYIHIYIYIYIYIKDRIKGRNSKDLKEAEEIKKRWQEYTEELYKKSFNDPDILECEEK